MSFMEQIYPAADALYTKAIEVQPDATLYANRSMVHHNYLLILRSCSFTWNGFLPVFIDIIHSRITTL